MGEVIDLALDRLGDLWFGALVGSFFVMICESARPKPGEGESKAAPQGFALLAAILSLVTPLMLFLHAVAQVPLALLGIVTLVGGFVIGAAVIGWIVAAAAPAMGRVLNRAAPVLAVPVFGLAAYVSWQNVVGLVNTLVSSFVR
ncbi:MAG: hypothetical protein ACREH4_12355 [Vitreimonas sp.]